MSEWQPIETIPKTGKNVLIFYKNQNDKGRIIKGFYAPKYTLEASDEANDYAEYDERSDIYYMPEGYYESIDNWPDYTSVEIIEGTPTHWMALPQPPGSDNEINEKLGKK